MPTTCATDGAALDAARATLWAESAAQGMVSPKRLLLTHHPVGTVRPMWLCQGSGANFTFSPPRVVTNTCPSIAIGCRHA